MQLLTWNIQWCLGTDGRVDPARIVREARAIADADVFCLQEVAANYPGLAGSAGEDQFEAIAALLPGFTAVQGVAVDTSAPEGGRRRFGNMILSRLPVLQVVRTRLPWPNDPGVRSMPRLLLEATLDAPGGPLRVMTTHLEYYSALQRRAQVEALRAAHVEACAHAAGEGLQDASNGPFHSQRHTASALLVGDFNIRPEDPLRARLMAPFDEAQVPAFDDVWSRLQPGVEQPPTTGVHDRVQWPEAFACDFVFATTDLRERLRGVRVDGATRASDHQPMVVELA